MSIKFGTVTKFHIVTSVLALTDFTEGVVWPSKRYPFLWHQSSSYFYVLKFLYYLFSSLQLVVDYISYGSADSPVFTSEIPVEGKTKKISPKNMVFTSPADGYYFVILLVPEANIKYTYQVNATELVTDITQYTSDHPSCVIDTERNCTKKYPNSQNFTLLAYTTTKI